MADEYRPDKSTSNQDREMSRRRFITYLLGFSVVATLGGVLTPIIGYLWPPDRASGAAGGRVEVGNIIDFPVGQGKVVPVNNRPVIIVNTEQVGLRAFSAICTHLACIVEWDQQRQFIHCPCHDGRFNAVNGAIISGPQPSPLPELAVSVESDIVYVSRG